MGEGELKCEVEVEEGRGKEKFEVWSLKFGERLVVVESGSGTAGKELKYEVEVEEGMLKSFIGGGNGC